MSFFSLLQELKKDKGGHTVAGKGSMGNVALQDALFKASNQIRTNPKSFLPMIQARMNINRAGPGVEAV